MHRISGCIRSTPIDFLSFLSGFLYARHAPNRLRSRRHLTPFTVNLTSQDYSHLQYQILWSHISLVSLIFHQDATCRAKHGSNVTACARDTAGLTQTSTEWDWLIIKTVCAATSNPSVTSSITVLLWPLHAASPTPPTKIWSNIFAILPFKPNRIVLPPVSCVYMTEESRRNMHWRLWHFSEISRKIAGVWKFGL